MGDLSPVASDIETTGFSSDSVITVAGLAHQMGEFLVLNTGGPDVAQPQLHATLERHAGERLELAVRPDERALLTALAEFAGTHLDGDQHYLTAYNVETWKGGFDLPFLRTACIQHEMEWPFPDMAYADMFDLINRFNTTTPTTSSVSMTISSVPTPAIRSMIAQKRSQPLRTVTGNHFSYAILLIFNAHAR
jgi:hypothetical protein